MRRGAISDVLSSNCLYTFSRWLYNDLKKTSKAGSTSPFEVLPPTPLLPELSYLQKNSVSRIGPFRILDLLRLICLTPKAFWLPRSWLFPATGHAISQFDEFLRLRQKFVDCLSQWIPGSPWNSKSVSNDLQHGLAFVIERRAVSTYIPCINT